MNVLANMWNGADKNSTNIIWYIDLSSIATFQSETQTIKILGFFSAFSVSLPQQAPQKDIKWDGNFFQSTNESKLIKKVSVLQESPSSAT